MAATTPEARHLNLDELLADPLPTAAAAHLARCVACRAQRLLALATDDASPDPTLTVHWSTADAFRGSGQRLGEHVYSCADGSLVSWVERADHRLALALPGINDAIRDRWAALRAVDHPSLVTWRELVEDTDVPLALCDPLPQRSVIGVLQETPGRVVDLLQQLAGALVALHRVGAAHGGLAAAPLAVAASGRLVLGPPSLLHPGSLQEDRVVLGGVVQRWTALAPAPGLDALAADLLGGSIEDDIALLTAVLELSNGSRSAALRYLDRGNIGMGGMGVVRRAWDSDLDRIVALKALKPGIGGARQFLEEARLTAQLQHPGVVPVYEIGELPDGRPYYAMEEVQGDGLSVLIRAFHADPPTATLRTLVDHLIRVCDTVAFAHSRGVVHRDLKPANIKVGAYGEVRVLDWGLAVPGGVVPERWGGTRGYAAPEQLAPGVVADPRMDVHALGRMLEQVLTGVRPGQERPEPAPPGPAELVDLVGACTAADPDDRPPTAKEVGEALRRWLTGEVQRQRADETVAAARPLRDEAAAARAEAARLRAEAAEQLESVPTWAPVEDKREAWALQDRAITLEGEAAVLETRYEQGLRAALDHHAGHRGALDGIAELYQGRLLVAEREGHATEAIRLRTLLADHDGGRHRGWLVGTGAVTLVTDPPGATVRLERFETHDRRLVPVFDCDLGETPLEAVPVAPGSWLLRVSHPDCEEVVYPVFLERGDHWDGVPPEGGDPEPVWLPPRGSLAPDDVYVPGGWFISGGDAGAVDPLPRARVWVDGFVMKRFPVTVAQYLAFLDDLVANGEEVAELVPARFANGEDIPLFHRVGNGWELTEAAQGPYALQPQWPAVCLTWFAAHRYAAWHATQTGRGWRLPHDQEWEKAARGVDGRRFPWGSVTDATFASHLPSHRQEPLLSPVGSFASDVGTYGVRDQGGNVRDWCLNQYERHRAHSPQTRLQVRGVRPTRSSYVNVRGGAFSSVVGHVFSATRLVARPGDRPLMYGIRPCRRCDT